MLEKMVSVIHKSENEGRPYQDFCCRAWNNPLILDLRSSERDMNLASTYLLLCEKLKLLIFCSTRDEILGLVLREHRMRRKSAGSLPYFLACMACTFTVLSAGVWSKDIVIGYERKFRRGCSELMLPLFFFAMDEIVFPLLKTDFPSQIVYPDFSLPSPFLPVSSVPFFHLSPLFFCFSLESKQTSKGSL